MAPRRSFVHAQESVELGVELSMGTLRRVKVPAEHDLIDM
jgi:hypothetical protein